jgi:hypothetical protein
VYCVFQEPPGIPSAWNALCFSGFCGFLKDTKKKDDTLEKDREKD